MILGRSLVIAGALALPLLSGGCTAVRDRQGFLIDDTLVSAIQPGVDNRDSVMASIGRPSFTGEFTPNDWYYVSRNTKNMAFNSLKPESQTILHVRFDQAGNVAAVERKGMEQVASISPSGDKTPTLGRRRSLWAELFGNIGAVGSATPGGSTPDNPDGRPN
ncbi:MAG: outer membrane protein assembly factor BamE [Alphaproteobacteria bacterium]|nr:outer membrane protein assembly factor BamE [Alphaproteobacteria bacterium]MDB5720477.1 outer membrane protein assembly factor BamE [Alphaproteobacteria bacterium]